jgi:hypothetical protein
MSVFIQSLEEAEKFFGSNFRYEANGDRDCFVMCIHLGDFFLLRQIGVGTSSKITVMLSLASLLPPDTILAISYQHGTMNISGKHHRISALPPLQEAGIVVTNKTILLDTGAGDPGFLILEEEENKIVPMLINATSFAQDERSNLRRTGYGRWWQRWWLLRWPWRRQLFLTLIIFLMGLCFIILIFSFEKIQFVNHKNLKSYIFPDFSYWREIEL